MNIQMDSLSKAIYKREQASKNVKRAFKTKNWRRLKYWGEIHSKYAKQLGYIKYLV